MGLERPHERPAPDLVEALATVGRVLSGVVATATRDAGGHLAPARRHDRQCRRLRGTGGLEMILHAHDVCTGLGVPSSRPPSSALRLRDHTLAMGALDHARLARLLARPVTPGATCSTRRAGRARKWNSHSGLRATIGRAIPERSASLERHADGDCATERPDAGRCPAEPGARAGRGRGGLRRDGPQGPGRGSRAAGRCRRRHRVPALPHQAGAHRSRARGDVRVAARRRRSRAQTEADAGAAFETFFFALAGFQARHRALAESMATAIDLPASAEPTRDALRAAIGELVDARASGRRDPLRHRRGRHLAAVLRRRAHDRARGDLQPVLRQRYLTIILDGLRPTAASRASRASRSTSPSSTGSRSAAAEVNDGPSNGRERQGSVRTDALAIAIVCPRSSSCSTTRC